MFSLDIVDTDNFLDMPCSAQSLYFHLGMRADDDGFVSSPKRIVNTTGAAADDLKLLIAKGFIIPFDSGVCVIKDWKVNNFLRSDRYTPTRYIAEKAGLEAVNGVYLQRGIPPGIPNVNQVVDNRDTQYRLGKDSVGKDNNLITPKPPEPKEPKPKENKKLFIPPTVEEVAKYCRERKNGIDAQYFVDYYTASGWLRGKGTPIKDWKSAVRCWERNKKNPPAQKKSVASAPECGACAPDDFVEYPRGSGKYIPAAQVPKEAGCAV